MRPSRRQRLAIILLFIGIALILTGFGLWASYKIEPNWFPPWFDKLFVILEGFGLLVAALGAILSDLVLPIWERLLRHEPFEGRPIHSVTYKALIERLGPSGRIAWIDRGISSTDLLLEHDRIAIIAEMKSGKTREAAELIRLAQTRGLISAIYEPLLALNRIRQDTLADAVAAEMRPDRCLFLVDELGLRQDWEQLSTCIQTICELRPTAYFLITLQRERLDPTVRAWLDQHRFHDVSLPDLTADQRLELIRDGIEVLDVAVTQEAITTLAGRADITKPWDIVSVLQSAPLQGQGVEPLSAEDIRGILARSDQETWAEQRRVLTRRTPGAEELLTSIATFISAGVTPREGSIRRYASFLMGSDWPTRKKTRLLDAAARRWSRYDIVASQGLYTIPEPRLLPLLFEIEEAHNLLTAFIDTYNPGIFVSVAQAFTSPLDVLVRFRLQRMPSSRPVNWRRRRTFRHVSSFWNIAPRLVIRLLGSLLSWPADRALLLQELGRPTARAAYLSSIAFVGRGLGAFDSGDYSAALEDFDRAIALNSNSARALSRRALTLYATDHLTEALSDFNRAVELDGDYAWATGYRGLTYLAMDRYEDALADFDRTIELKGDLAWATAHRGQTYLFMGRYEDALSELDRAIELNVDYAWAIGHRGKTYQLMDRYEDALADLDRAIELDGTMAWAIAQRGQTYRFLNRYEDALADLDRAIELDGTMAWAIAQRGVTYRLMGRFDEALSDSNQAVSLAPSNHWYHYQRSLVHMAADRPKDAQQDLKQASALARDSTAREPADQRQRLHLALYLLVAGSTAEAEREYRDTIDQCTNQFLLQEAADDLAVYLAVRPDDRFALLMQDALQGRIATISQNGQHGSEPDVKDENIPTREAPKDV